MGRVEIKRAVVVNSCVCKGHQAKHNILVKGMYATPQAEIPLCVRCFKELKEKIASN